jgi:hypothetical protein
MPTKLSRSPVTKVLDAADATVNAAGSVFDVQRYGGKFLAVQIEFNQDPNGGAGFAGDIIIQGRFTPNAPWGVLADSSTHTELDYTSYSATVLTQIADQGDAGALVVPVPAAPQIRIRRAGVVDVAGGTTMTVWVMER